MCFCDTWGSAVPVRRVVVLLTPWGLCAFGVAPSHWCWGMLLLTDFSW